MKQEVKQRAIMNFIQYQALLAFKPEKQAALIKKAYRAPGSLELFTSKREIDNGLSNFPNKSIRKHITGKGNVLVVGCSGGRETLPLARDGHKVTGIDIVKGMISKARYWARKYKLQIDYKVKDITDYFPRKGSLDYIFFTVFILVIGKKERISLLRRLGTSLRGHGLIFVLYHHPMAEVLLMKDRQLLRQLRKKNRYYENNNYFLGGAVSHEFSRKELKAEAKAAGFEVIDWSLESPKWTTRKYGTAVLRKI